MPFLTTVYFEAFRTKFQVPDINKLRWFPGHMGLGMKKMQQKIKFVDCIIEVHDARIPVSGRNPLFKNTVVGPKPHILVLNKKDLTRGDIIPQVKTYIRDREQVENVIFTNCRDQKCTGLKELVPTIQTLIASANRYNRSESMEFNVMVIGVPNVGKSSLINALRVKYLKKGKAAAVGPHPGVTRDVQTKIKISNIPKVYILDTPGVLTPNIPNDSTGMKLAACGTIKDNLVGSLIIADYILFWFNQRGDCRYFDFFGITEPSDNISLLLAKVAIERNMFSCIRNTTGDKVNKPNLQSAADLFVEQFRRGLFGTIMLDLDIMNLNLR